MVMMYSSFLVRNSSLALPSRIADKELPTAADVQRGTWLDNISIDFCYRQHPLKSDNLLLCLWSKNGNSSRRAMFCMGLCNYDTEITNCSILHTIELGLGQDTSTDRKTILPIADIKGRNGRMVGHLAEQRERDKQQSEKGGCQIPFIM